MKDKRQSLPPVEANGSINKIRILHCIETISSGGVEQIRLTMVRGLDRAKYEHKIICTWKGGAVADALEKEGVELIVVGSFKHPFEWRKHQKVLSIIKSYQPHIIHGAIFEGMTMAAIGGKLGKVPVIILEETSHPISRSRKAMYLQKLLVKMADKIIGISPTVVAYLRDKVGISKDKIVVINNGVNKPQKVSDELLAASKLKWGITDKDILIGSVGRLYNEVKRFSDILDAVHLIGNPNIKFLLVGDGPDRDYLSDYAKNLGITDQFIPVGFQLNTAIFYAMMDIFCLPSAHEGFGLVAAEAMLYKLPVIASKVGGLQDIVVEGETGFLLPPAQPALLAKKIQWLIDYPDRSAEMGFSGYLRAIENYTAEHYCKEVDRLYSGLLQKKNEIL